MKTRTITAISLIVLGLIITILGSTSIFGEGGGYIIMWIGFPLVITGIILLFSLIGASLALLGALINFFFVITGFYYAPFAGIIIFIAGILYGIIEGIIKLAKKNRGQ